MFKQEPDKEVEEFYNNLTFRAFVKNYEENVERNKYEMANIDFVLSLFFKFKDLMTKIDNKNYEEKFLITVRRLVKFVFSNKVTKNFTIEYMNDKFYIDFEGNYPNIHYVNTQGIIGLCGLFGLKLKDISLGDLHTRLELEKSFLFKKDELLTEERKKLYNENCEMLINYYNIIQDKRHHLWIKMSKSDETLISFKDYNIGMKDITTIINEIIKYSKNNKKSILQLFEKLNWVELEKSLGDNLNFNCKLNINDHPVEYQIIRDILKKYGTVKENGDKFSFY
ncbi:MAG: hypothetical protein P8Y70_16065 [Candidatus Lokiarchaeota archaeon]